MNQSDSGKLGILNISDIDLGDRARTDYKDLESLADSIKQRGLICPIAVSIHPEIKDKYLLAAGGRRLAAVKLLGQPTISCRIYDHILSDLEHLLIEEAENSKREDLEYPEKCRQARRIRDMQEDIYGKKTSTSADAPGVSLRDTADFMGVSHSTLSLDISLANAMDDYPELELDKCKTQAEAMKLKAKAEDAMIREALAARASRIMGKEDTLRSKLMDSYLIGDFFKHIKDVPDGYYDIVEIDPPYAIDLANKKKKTSGSYTYGEDGYNEIDPKDYTEFMWNTLTECYRTMTSNSWLVCWFGPEPWFEKVYDWISMAGFETRRLTGKWFKPSGQTMQPLKYLANCDEQFFYASKGSPTIKKPGRSNIFEFSPVPSASKIHPTERPINMMQEILSTFGIEGSKVLTPYAGSGNTLLAAALNKMMPTGFDLTQQYKEGYILKVQEVFK